MTHTTAPLVTVEALRVAAFDLQWADSPAARKAARAALNALVGLAVAQGESSKHEIAFHAGIAYSTVNDIARRDRAVDALAAPAAPAYVGRSLDEILAACIDPEGLKGAPTYESRERNERKPSAGAHDQRCPLCSSPLKDNDVQTSGAWIEITTDGWLLPADLTDAEEALVEASGRHMGAFVIGSGCARRVPAAYKTPVTKRAAV